MDGLLLIDKPQDVTSHDVVALLRRRLKLQRVGHTGTLDPIATGLMIVVAGEATKLSDDLTGQEKRYSVQIRLGVRTNTLDRAGEIIEEKPVQVSLDQVTAAISRLAGRFDWQVPAYSAVKVAGQPLYKLARRNVEVDAPVKSMAFWDIQMRQFAGQTLVVDLSCAKGSYIRTWVDQLGTLLGCGAMVDELRRLSVGSFSVDAAVKPDGELEKAFIPLAKALPNYRAVIADRRESTLLSHGQIPRDIISRLIPEQKRAFAEGTSVPIKVVNASGDLLALLAVEPGQGLKIRRVFSP